MMPKKRRGAEINESVRSLTLRVTPTSSPSRRSARILDFGMTDGPPAPLRVATGALFWGFLTIGLSGFGVLRSALAAVARQFLKMPTPHGVRFNARAFRFLPMVRWRIAA